MMITTCKEFNEKYKDFLDEGQKGLIIEVPGIVMYLDRLFGDLTQIPGFKYSHIATNQGMARIYNSLPELLPYVGHTMDKAIEERLNFILTVEREIESRKLGNN
jgi:hypothetical protein